MVTPLQEPLLNTDNLSNSIAFAHSRNVSMVSIDASDPTRLAHINSANEKYMDNRISTSRYNCFNFIPKTVFMQFRRVANVYFLIMSVLMWIGTYYPTLFSSPLSPGGERCMGAPDTLGPDMCMFLRAFSEA